MSSEDKFEKRLQSLPQRQIPADWRKEILDAARSAALADSRPSLPSTFNSKLSTLLWPHPVAWAGLAAVWLLVLGLNLASSDGSPSDMARQAAPPPAQIRELLKQQAQMLTELVGPGPQPDRPKPAASRPHSRRRDKISYV